MSPSVGHEEVIKCCKKGCTDILQEAVHHHHQNTRGGTVSRMNNVSRVPEMYRNNVKLY